MRTTVFAFAVLQSFLAVSASSACYRLNGGDWAERTMNSGLRSISPCGDPSSGPTSCCSEEDMCLGNGLCLDLGSNNAFSVQGCTDPSWPEPCASQIRESMDPETVAKGQYTYVWQCKRSFRTPYCIGKDVSCCKDKSHWIYLPRIKGPHFNGDPKKLKAQDDQGSSLEKQTHETAGAAGDDETIILSRLNVAAAIVLPLVGIIVAICAWQCTHPRVWRTKNLQNEDRLVNQTYRDRPNRDAGRSVDEIVLNQRPIAEKSVEEGGAGLEDLRNARTVVEENPWGDETRLVEKEKAV